MQKNTFTVIVIAFLLLFLAFGVWFLFYERGVKEFSAIKPITEEEFHKFQEGVVEVEGVIEISDKPGI